MFRAPRIPCLLVLEPVPGDGGADKPEHSREGYALEPETSTSFNSAYTHTTTTDTADSGRDGCSGGLRGTRCALASEHDDRRGVGGGCRTRFHALGHVLRLDPHDNRRAPRGRVHGYRIRRAPEPA